DYEGPVSGGRGTVRQWDAGVYEPLPAAPVATDVAEQAGVPETDRGPVELQIMLKGRRWQVCCQLWRQSGDPGGRLWACFTAVEPPSPRPGSDPLQ
ncbi:MAG: hypothetical protein NZ703_14240, partial [Gemmataceae bacterium]|nr:hypothetical protein [Gemmataceae bacterium]